MTKEELIEKYPQYLNPEGIKTPIECENGWLPLIDKMCHEFDFFNHDNSLFIIRITQKYGALRVYTNWLTDEIDSIIRAAETKSLEICEICGKPGDIIGYNKPRNSWIVTRCEEHRED